MRLPLFSLLAASALATTIASPAFAQGAAADDWGAFGIQTRNIDPAVKPGDDFNRHVNGTWLATAEIPADRTSTGGFIELRDLSEERMKAILEEVATGTHPAGSPAARVAAVYNAFNDMAAIEAAGLAPLYPTLTKIYAAKNSGDLLDLFAAPGMASPIGMGVGPDDKQSSINALYARQAQLGLPDRNFYLVDSPRNRDIVAKYKAYLAFILGEVGYADPANAADAVFRLETKMARENWDRALGRNRDLTYNKLTIDEFAALAPNVPLRLAIDRITSAVLASRWTRTNGSCSRRR